MNYLKIKIYLKTNVNILLLALKWFAIIFLCLQVMTIAHLSTRVFQELFSPPDEISISLSSVGPNINIKKEEENVPLILLWNNYQLTGSRVYKTIFEKITTGKCKVILHHTAFISPNYLVARELVRSRLIRDDSTTALLLSSTCQIFTGRNTTFHRTATLASHGSWWRTSQPTAFASAVIMTASTRSSLELISVAR